MWVYRRRPDWGQQDQDEGGEWFKDLVDTRASTDTRTGHVLRVLCLGEVLRYLGSQVGSLVPSGLS